MTFQDNPLSLAFFLAALIAGMLAAFGWSRRSAPGGMAFVVMMLGQIGWASFEGLELFVADLGVKKLFYAMGVAAAATTIQALLVLVLQFAGQGRRLGRVGLGLSVAPHLVFTAMAWTNDWHHLYGTLVWGDQIQGFPIAIPVHGIGFRAHVVYFYGQVALSLIVLARSAAMRPGFPRFQSIAMSVGIALAWAWHAVTLSRSFGLVPIDTESLIVPLVGLTYLPTLSKYRSNDLVSRAGGALLGATGDLVIILDNRGRVAGLNPAMERVLGWPWSGDRAIGREVSEVFAEWPALAPRLTGLGTSWESSFEVSGPSVAPGLVYEGCGTRIDLGRGGGPEGVVIALRDATIRKRFDRERARRRDAQVARERAEAATAAKDNFLATLSHELRTPLTPALAALGDLVEDPRTPSEIREVLRVVQRGVEMEARLIDDLLDMTRITRGKLRVVPAVVDAHEIVREALRVCEADLRTAGLVVEVELEAESAFVQADSSRLTQVVWNLLKNAAKYTPRGRRVLVRSLNQGDADDRVPSWVLQVIDNGVGIDPEFLPRIFEPFAQEESSDGPRRGGLGLGLAICKALIAAQGGRLLASSAGPGRGSTFTIGMPLAEAPRRSAAAPGSDDPPLSTSSTIRILLVDDDADTRWMLARLIRKWGHGVLAAGDVQTALELAESEGFEVLLTDVGLPDGTGHDLLRALESRVSSPFAAIALTGFGRDDDLRRSRDQGFVEHLTKPVDARRLHEAIQQAALALVRE